jgi:hypothetical protein
MINISETSRRLTELMAPALPYLLDTDVQSETQIPATLGSVNWELSKTLWKKLSLRFERDPRWIEILLDISNNPSDEDAVAAWRFNIKKMLMAEPELAMELATDLENYEDSSSKHSVIAISSSGAFIGGILGMALLGPIGAVTGAGLGATIGGISRQHDQDKAKKKPDNDPNS